MVTKSKYYAHISGIDPTMCAPVDNGNGPELVGIYADSINSINDDDTGFLAWKFDHKKQEFISGIQYHLDTTARTRGYDSVDSATKYIGGKKPLWDAEGVALRDWTVDVWDASFIVLADITDGTRPEPTIDELLAELPEMIWTTI